MEVALGEEALDNQVVAYHKELEALVASKGVEAVGACKSDREEVVQKAWDKALACNDDDVDGEDRLLDAREEEVVVDNREDRVGVVACLEAKLEHLLHREVELLVLLS